MGYRETPILSTFIRCVVCITTDQLFNGERTFKDLEMLAVEVGSRPGGSEAEDKAVEYIASEFESLGLETSVQEFAISSGREVSKRLEVVEPFEEEIKKYYKDRLRTPP